jgi:glutathione S-transferase
VAGAEPNVVKHATGFIHEAYKIAEPMLAGREFFFDHFTAPDAHFFWCMRRSAQLGVDASSFPNCTAHFERIKTRASVQKLFAWEKSVNEEFAKAA